jgi:hypothetical protein
MLGGMRTVLRAIHSATRAYSTLPFFDFLRDESLTPRRRLAFVPCMAPFIMDFGDLNRYVLRDEASTDALQALVNAHTYEDDHHWPWYLDDLAALGYDERRSTTQVLRDLYGDATAVNRLLAARLAHLIADATPVERLAVVEAIEETGNVLFGLTAHLARRVERDDGIELRYFGDFHLARESGHLMSGAEDGTLAAIVLDDAQRARCTELAGRVFDLFEEWVDELLDYAISAEPRTSAA